MLWGSNEGFPFVRNWYPLPLEANTLKPTANQRPPRVTTRQNPVRGFFSNSMDIKHSFFKKQWLPKLFSYSDNVTATDPSSAFQEESQVLNICPPLNKRYVCTWCCYWLAIPNRCCCISTLVSSLFRCISEDKEMEPGVDSTTHCVRSEGRRHLVQCGTSDLILSSFWYLDVCVSGGTAEFCFLELSQSQDVRGEVNSQQEEGNRAPQSGSERCTKLGISKCFCVPELFRPLTLFSKVCI